MGETADEETKVPEYGLKLKLDHVYPEKRKQGSVPRPKQLLQLLPLIIRYLFYYFYNKIWGRAVVMDYLETVDGKQIYGVPIGGIGGGTIGRGFRGEFCRYQMIPGMYEYNVVEANQFIVTIKNGKQETIFQSLLSTYKKRLEYLNKWESKIDASKCTYTGLYPRSWTEYDLSEYGVKLICRQISPVIPHNYRDSSIPCAVFVWSIENVCNEDRTVTITFTFKTGTGNKKRDAKSRSTCKGFSDTDYEGVMLYHTINNTPCSYAISARKNDRVNITKCNRFDPKSDGSSVWNQLYANGKFDKIIERKYDYVFGDIACGVAAKVTLKPLDKTEIEILDAMSR